MTKTMSTRIKAMPISTSTAGYVLLYTGIVMAFAIGALLVAWIIFPDVFYAYLIPILAIFLPMTFYVITAFTLYYKKYRIKR